MKIKELIKILEQLNSEDIVEIFDPNGKGYFPITGLIYGGDDGIVTLYNDVE